MRMQELMNLNQHFATGFNSALGDPKQLGHVSIEPPQRQGGGARGLLARLAGSKAKGVTLPTLPLDSYTMNHVLVFEADEDIRRQARGPCL